MKFRPCIDIHKGKVKQIVGSTLSEDGASAKENYVSDKSPADFACMYKEDGLKGGHIIKLSATEEDEKAAEAALKAYPGGLQIGGGVNDENSEGYLEKGASHVIVTSFVFGKEGLNEKNLVKIMEKCGKEHIVLDLSCKKDEKGIYRLAVNRWQVLTEFVTDRNTMRELSEYCDEFLIHGIANEGMMKGPDRELIEMMADSPVPVTYAGGISTEKDIDIVKEAGKGRVDFTVGSALNIFGGNFPYETVKKYL